MSAEPLHAEDAEAALTGAGLDAAGAIRKGALLIRDHGDWYGKIDGLDARAITNRWLEEERRVVADGYSGLRITGNTSFVKADAWDTFMDYESLVDRALEKHRVVTLCSYMLDKIGPSEMLDVVRRHACTLDQPDSGWRILTARYDLDLTRGAARQVEPAKP